MNKKYVFPASLLFAVAVVGGVYENQYAHQESAVHIPTQSIPATTTSGVPASTTSPTKQMSPGATTTLSPVPTPVPTPTTPGYTQSQVAQHATATSCWTTINNNVYDLTSWINHHPGGSGPILSLCGHDGTASFQAQHGGQARPEQELKNFYIGPLK